LFPPESIFSPDFARSTAERHDKILLMPGPTWYAKDIFGGTLKVPAGEMTAAMPLRWNSEPDHDRPGRRRPWIVSKHTKNMRAADRLREVRTTSPVVKAKRCRRVPVVRPAATSG
jgi:hypothetical protein